ncbi:MAG: UDP-2,4-diacetamido-2,4,6-trideoxy-beta-L-altropyranose hydrolase [Flavobacterium sp.]|jgi:UDP-2,4-diacetamido-2,4,6-trideoxy-beta-L-altropyranose hydrolase
MNFNSVVFRVDSSRQIGSGHLMRCLALARVLKKAGAKCSFVSRALDGNLNGFVSSEGFTLIELPKSQVPIPKPGKSEPVHSNWREAGWEIDALETLKAVSNQKVDWLIVDHYGLWESWHIVMRGCDAKIMVIDDLADRKHDCDLLLDQNLGSDFELYRDLIPLECRSFFGPDYALLRPEFSDYRESSLKRRHEGKIDHILLNFGGGDPSDYIGKTLGALLNVDIPHHVTISIIYGGLATMTSGHQYLISCMPVKVKIYGAVTNMAEILSSCDLVIGAAGGSAWERCCLGVPSLVFPVALNQVNIAKSLSTFGVSTVLGARDLANGKFESTFSNMFQKENLRIMSCKASSICDGTGVVKIIRELNA